jgi:hypothetical protein
MDRRSAWANCHTVAVGLWVQAIGVRGDVPDGIAVEPGEDEFALSWAPGTGWSWAILSQDWERDLGRLAVDAATLAAAPVLTFLIADSDLAILYGAGPGEPPVVASTGEYEEPGPPTQASAFAEWTERHAPAPVAAERFDEWAQTQYVFAEEGLAHLLAQMGLVAPTTQPPETLDG